MTWQEEIAPNENEVFEGYAQEMKAYQAAYASKRGKFERTLHTKAHVGAVGELKVHAPAPFRAGVFAEDRAWPVFVRFSNGSPGHQSDGVPDIRGLGVKLVGVPGKKIIPGLEDAQTQDFLFIQNEATPIKGPHDFMHIVRAGREGGQAGLPFRLIKRLGFRAALKAIRGFLKMPKVRSLGTSKLYTAVPLRCGDLAVKLGLVPDAPEAKGPPKGRDALREEIVQRLLAGPVTFKLVAQQWVDATTTPIEDASVRWTSPWVEVGALTIPKQDVTSAKGQQIGELIESLSFDPWHAVPEHRPLGAMMRARAPAYRESVIARGAAPEPTSVPSLE